jgi:hypothetical protein
VCHNRLSSSSTFVPNLLSISFKQCTFLLFLYIFYLYLFSSCFLCNRYFSLLSSLRVSKGKTRKGARKIFRRGRTKSLQRYNLTKSFIVVSAFRPRGVPGPTSKLSPHVPAQMGRRETEHEGGKRQAKGETRGLRVVLRPGRVRLQ